MPSLKPRRIEPQTYRIGRWVAFQTDRLTWRLALPAVADDPMRFGFIDGSVTDHSTLKACVARVQARERMARRAEAMRPRGYKWS